MREIKFRAWDGEKIILDGETLIRNNEWWCGKPNENGLPLGAFSGIDGHVLMQYTGLKDKNGKEIYEGDIVLDNIIGSACEGPKQNIGQVIQYEGGEWVWYRKNHEIDQLTGGESLLYMLDGREVIGNIYEHPELI